LEKDCGVADEIRKLAEHPRVSSENTSNLVADILKEIYSVVNTTETVNGELKRSRFYSD